ncbi:MAG: DUF1232 domain-containing protein [Muribaculaceae bacterium]|nr:DUF1232 domain-containing protein [Muribaculaceae bacterium]
MKDKIKVFKDNLTKYAGFYNPTALFEKIKQFAKKAGEKTVYLVLILYYATFDKALPVKDRLMVVAALGYFILPLDFLPDALPGGFVDDAGALFYVVKHIWGNLSDETFRKAKQKLSEWFDDVDESALKVVEESRLIGESGDVVSD